jgi:hypothetical protein
MTLQSRAFVNKGTNFRVPYKAGDLLTGLKTGCLSKRILSMELIKVSCGIKGYLHYKTAACVQFTRNTREILPLTCRIKLCSINVTIKYTINNIH